ncbi:MAG TPA: hypothetical protein VH561_07115 [Micromonosporaceae bacterium]|jgi:hypothetical protein
MRRPSVVVLMIAAVITGIACAHPHEVPLPGQSPASTGSPSASASAPATGADQTSAVCDEALRATNDAKTEITAQINQVQGNPGGAAAALLTARAKATQLRSNLQDLRNRPIRANVRDALDQGIALLDHFLGESVQQLTAEGAQAEQQLQDFLDTLSTACAA